MRLLAGRMQNVAAERHARAFTGCAAHAEHVGEAAHDRQPATAFGIHLGKLGGNGSLVRYEADASIVHRCKQPVVEQPGDDLDRFLRVRVLDRVGQRFADGAHEVRKIRIDDTLLVREAHEATADLPAQAGIGRDGEAQFRSARPLPPFVVCHFVCSVFIDTRGPCHITAGGAGLRAVNARMATYTKPTGDELTDLAAEAAHSQARITTEKGDIVFTFYPEDAPQHAAAFIKLARAGFYDGLTFHRVEPGFVIQGGCPDGNGTGGPGYRLDAEFNENPHITGTVAMARSSDPNSAGSQFYICLGDAPFLNRNYTVFGHVVQGQNVVDDIRKGDVMTSVTIEEKAA